MATAASSRAYGTIWRWHFYAGLFVLPFILILSVTGAIYLFKPQIDRWEEREYQGQPMSGAVSADRQLAAALAASPGMRFNYYRLPARPDDATMIHMIARDGSQRDVFVSPQGKVLGSRDPNAKISETIARIHGSLLIGTWGDWLVELAASWTIVMILTGLYIWWPRPLRLAGALWPRLSLRGRPLLREIHRVTGFWIAGLVLVMLASGLPWAGAWGSAFQWARTEFGLVKGPQDWKIGVDGGHAGHHPDMPMAMPSMSQAAGLPLSVFVVKAQQEHLAFPALVLPPHAPQRFGPPTGDEWTAKSEAQNRWLGRQVTYDPVIGAETGRRGFADQHVIDRVVNTGVAWHEGQLFGWVNQLIGVLTAIALVTISILGVVMWLKRKPQGRFGAPPPAGAGAGKPWMIAALISLALLLPLFGLSLLMLLAIDRFVSRVTQRFAARQS
ncbi:PepSY-associated TM helix domain-containing protein [Altericroceibacterium endophyticum]|uniref:PepSY domain-containing protein n=1 Tax=Altericroceibacterium endophyticum TaxID=1808508 RepID=A0A6I4T679_9SPHN|nr:PepSY domain-containing protein [Altericroceibacterium endophyticum]MXO66704.1 PepSY domain-containing protein [Altericroceibacterium endophyticum]